MILQLIIWPILSAHAPKMGPSAFITYILVIFILFSGDYQDNKASW